MAPRTLIIFLLCLLLTPSSSAQSLRGEVNASALRPGTWLVLQETIGSEHRAIDSARVDAKGTFAFSQLTWPTGFYRIATGDDHVDLILGTQEPLVTLRFDGVPLQEHITVVASTENQRLWEYKRASREAQQRLDDIASQRAAASPQNKLLLDDLVAQETEVRRRQSAVLDRMIAQDSASYFSRVILTDRALMAAVERGTLAIRNAVRWDDPSLVRSAVYQKALMAVLQSATPASPDMLASATDSILSWASGDTTCWRFARWTLTDLFVTYGPPDVVQHIVDRYVLGPGTIVPPEQRLLTLVAEQLRVSIGSPAPDVRLPSPLRPDTTSLSKVSKGMKATVVFFYSSTCDHCHDQMPGLQAVYDDYRSKHVQVIGIALDDEAGQFEENLLERHLTFPCFTELAAWGSPAAKAFAVKATPTFFVLDESLHIVAKPYDSSELRTYLESTLGKP